MRAALVTLAVILFIGIGTALIVGHTSLQGPLTLLLVVVGGAYVIVNAIMDARRGNEQ